MKELGVEITMAHADITDSEAVRRLIQRIKRGRRRWPE